ncbi:MAG: phytanoyl-CoA dioxygenase family protein [Deltaproteobacteria bacterium]|nr:phytanoyl-CoA dioxygenase family protein [Deltaproteobacteria bacterium]
MSETGKLSAADQERLRAEYADQGYVVLPGVVPKDRLEGLRRDLAAEFERVKSSGQLMNGGGTFSGHLNCFPGAGARFAYEALSDAGVLDLVRALHPDAQRQPNVGCNFNLPGSVVQHYHPDREFTRAFVIVNIAVVDTEIKNGAIDVLPGTQKKFYKFWRFTLENAPRLTRRLPMKQGDVLVRTSNLWHRGMPNLTDTARPMLAFTWEDGGSTLADPFAQEQGRIVFRQNWFRPTMLGRLRERTFVVAPITYSAWRFARSLIGNKGY